MTNHKHIVLLGLMLLFNFSAMAQIDATPEPPNVNASSFILMDYHSGHVLAAENPHAQVGTSQHHQDDDRLCGVFRNQIRSFVTG